MIMTQEDYGKLIAEVDAAFLSDAKFCGTEAAERFKAASLLEIAAAAGLGAFVPGSSVRPNHVGEDRNGGMIEYSVVSGKVARAPYMARNRWIVPVQWADPDTSVLGGEHIEYPADDLDLI